MSPKQYKLIDGLFTLSEASEVLFALIDSKIKFHTLKSFCKEEQEGSPCEKSRKRIRELIALRDELKHDLAQANPADLVKLSSTVQLELAGTGQLIEK